MSKSIKILALFGALTALVACGGGMEDEEFIVVEPVMEEPTYNKM